MRRGWVLAGTFALFAGCASASPSTAGLRVGPIPQGVTAKTSLVEYEVPASEYSEFVREMRARGPLGSNRRWAGMTTWRVSWTYQYEREGPFCALRRVNVLVESKVEVPRLALPPGVTPDTVFERRWKTFRESIVDHEAGHVRLALQGGGQVAKAMQGLTASTCEALGQQANTTGQRETEAIRRRQAQYDGVTRHGLLQGTLLEPDRRPPATPRP